MQSENRGSANNLLKSSKPAGVTFAQAKGMTAGFVRLARALVAQLYESYPSDTMHPMKIAISLPDPIFEAAEHLAEELRIPRSQLYAEALASYLNTHGGVAITAKLNEVHGSTTVPVEPALAKAKLRILDREAW